MPSLAHSLIVATGARPDRWALFLHGLFGRGGNWRGLARRFVDARPAWGAVLVDVRLHGASQGFAPPHTVGAAAADLDALDGAVAGKVDAVVGHSLGGKVALEYVARRGGALDHAWIVDAMPGARARGRGGEDALRVLGFLDSVPPRLPSREAFLERARVAGLDDATASWLAMNLATSGGGYALGLDLPALRALFEDYLVRDLWPVVEQPPGPVQIEIIIGERSSQYDPDERRRAAAIAAAHPDRVEVHTLPTGHWVHVEDPDGLLSLLTRSVEHAIV